MKALPRIEGETQCWEHNCEVYVKADDYAALNEYAALVQMERDSAREEVKKAHQSLTWTTAEVERLLEQQAVIYDGNAVFLEIRKNGSHAAISRTSPENVCDVLDAVARLQKRLSSPTTGQ